MVEIKTLYIVVKILVLPFIFHSRGNVYAHNCTCVKQNCFKHFENIKTICYGGVITQNGTTEETSGYSCDCSYRGLESIPKDLPTNTLSLNLQGNNITNLERYHFEEHIEMVILDLRNNQINDLPPKVFFHMVNLVELYLTTKQIHSKSFRRLRKLQLLDIDGENVLSELQGVMFKQLNSLKTLTINNGNITTFGKNILQFSRKLENLNLQNNIIEGIEKNIFAATPKLKMVDLSHNKIQTLKSLFGNTVNKSKLRVFKISNNQLSTFPTEFEELESLQEIDLIGNRLQNLSTVNLSKLTKLRILNLQDNKIDDFPWENVSKLSSVTINLLGNLFTSKCDCKLLYALYKSAANFSGICTQEKVLSKSKIMELFMKRRCNICQYEPCQNNGVCTLVSSEKEIFQCTCKEEYTGKLCETHLISASTTPSTSIMTSTSEQTISSSTHKMSSPKPSMTIPKPSMTTPKSEQTSVSSTEKMTSTKPPKTLKNQGESNSTSKYKGYFKTSLIINIALAILLVVAVGFSVLLCYKYKKLHYSSEQFKYKQNVELK